MGNGCPFDAPVSATSKAYPICIAKNGGASPYDDGDFTCVLACPCDIEVGADGIVQCTGDSHAHCPDGARCERGELRHMSKGVCTYPKGLPFLPKILHDGKSMPSLLPFFLFKIPSKQP